MLQDKELIPVNDRYLDFETDLMTFGVEDFQ